MEPEKTEKRQQKIIIHKLKPVIMEEKTFEKISFLVNRVDNIKKLELAMLNHSTDTTAGVFMPLLNGFEFATCSVYPVAYLDKTDLDSFRAEIGQAVKTWCERVEELAQAELSRFIKETPDPICD